MNEIGSTSSRPRRPHRSLDEASTLAAAWQSSGLTKESFCRSQGIQRSTLSSCLLRTVGRRPSSVAPAGFVEIRPPAVVDGLVLELGDGLRVVGLDVDCVVALVGALRAGRR